MMMIIEMKLGEAAIIMKTTKNGSWENDLDTDDTDDTEAELVVRVVLMTMMMMMVKTVVMKMILIPMILKQNLW
jgi:hypothetical protein